MARTASNLRVAPEPQPQRRREPLGNIDAEEAVLGAALLSTDALSDAAEVLDVEDFWHPPHRAIFEAMLRLQAASEPVDCLTVADALERHGQLKTVGGPERLLALEAATPTLTHVHRYARIVSDFAMARRLAAAAAEVSEIAHSRPDDIGAAVDQAEALIYAVAERRIVESTAHLRDLLSDTLDNLEELYYDDAPRDTLQTGFSDLDKVLAGVAPSSLLIVGGRPSMGKTAFGLSVAANVAAADLGVLIFSLEMNRAEITQRLLAQDSRVDATRLRTGKLSAEDWNKVTRSVPKLAASPIWVDDNPSVSVNEIRAKARRLKSRHGSLGLVVVDYLQLMSGRSTAENRQVEIAEISRALKILAREIETPVLAMSQLSRGLESRSDKRPMLADLRESGSIEQDADIVMFIYRDEVYDDETPNRGLAEIIVAKHRNGPTGTARLAFLPSCTLFAGATSDAA